MILVIDTETTGFPRNAPVDDPSQPYLVELACLVMDHDGTVIDYYENLIRPDGWTIPPETTAIHGITTEEALEYGVPLDAAMADFMELVDKADALAAFNLKFDAAIIRTAIARTAQREGSHLVRDWTVQVDGLAQLCVMEAAREVMRLPMKRGNGLKNPNLQEAFRHFYGQDFAHGHSAKADLLACASVHLALRGRKRIVALEGIIPAKQVAPQTPPVPPPGNPDGESFHAIEEADAARAAIRMSPGVWMESCAKIVDKEKNLVSPSLNVFQWRMSDAYEHQRRMGVACRQIDLKPRRVGGTTMGAGITYHHMRNFPCNGVMMADTHDKSTELLNVYRTLAEHDSFDWGAQDNTGGARRLELGHSNLVQKSAEAPKGTRGLTLQADHNSEVAFWPSTTVKSAEATNMSLRSALAKHPQTSGLEESTPYGSSGVFFTTWQDARWPVYDDYWKKWAGLMPADEPGPGNGYIRVFAAWYEFLEYSLPFDHPQEADDIKATLSARERRGILLYGWTYEQIKWRRFTIKNDCGNDEIRFDEEYAEDPQSCFLSSGSPRFDGEGLTVLEHRARQLIPKAGLLVMHDGEDKRVQFVETGLQEAIALQWEAPRIGCRYLVSVDPHSGKIVQGGKERDCSSILVWRASYVDSNGRTWCPRLVARLKAGWRSEFKPTAKFIDILSRLYGRCIVVVENNVGVGLIDYLRDLQVPLYIQKRFDTISSKWTEEIGWNTTEENRELTVGALADVIRESSNAKRGMAVDIACPHVVGELRTFVRNNKGKYEASSGRHDDDVMSAGIGLYTLPSATLMREEIRQRRGPSDADQWTTTR